ALFHELHHVGAPFRRSNAVFHCCNRQRCVLTRLGGTVFHRLALGVNQINDFLVCHIHSLLPNVGPTDLVEDATQLEQLSQGERTRRFTNHSFTSWLSQ